MYRPAINHSGEVSEAGNKGSRGSSDAKLCKRSFQSRRSRLTERPRRGDLRTSDSSEKAITCRDYKAPRPPRRLRLDHFDPRFASAISSGRGNDDICFFLPPPRPPLPLIILDKLSAALLFLRIPWSPRLFVVLFSSPRIFHTALVRLLPLAL